MPLYTSKETLLRRQKQRRAKKFAFISLAIIFVLVSSFFITQLINLTTSETKEESFLLETETEPSEVTDNPAILYGPFISLEEEVSILSSNYQNLAVPENGRVYIEYFDNALFIGDSLGDGFREYQSTLGIENSIFYTNRNLQPSSFLNGSYISAADFSEPFDAILEIKNNPPEKIYVILGTNAMHLENEVFLDYYTQLIVSLKEAAPNSYIYINSLLPVTASTSLEEDKYNPQKILLLNNALAKIASSNSVYFLNIYDIFATEDGHLNEDLAYSDGIHLTPTGYKNWLDYLITHTVYNENSPFVPGSPYVKP